jgi:hypothetical protein
MTEPRADRPVPGPVRPVAAADGATEGAAPAERFTGLTERPVAEHVEVFETEHDRLQAELGTIDRV